MKIALIVLLLLPFAGYGQSKETDGIDSFMDEKVDREEVFDLSFLPIKDNVLKYEKTIEFDSNFTKDVLYENAKLMFLNTFKNSNAVLQIDDKTIGTIAGKGSFDVIYRGVMNYKTLGTLSFTLYIKIKDMKCRIEIYDMSYKGYFVYGAFGIPSSYTPIEVPVINYYYMAKEKGKKYAFRFLAAMNDKSAAFLDDISNQMKIKPTKDNW